MDKDIIRSIIRPCSSAEFFNVTEGTMHSESLENAVDSIHDALENDKPLYERLADMGFEKVVTPVTGWRRLVNAVCNKMKYKPEVHDYWLQQTVDGSKYEVYECDIWYTQLRVDGEILFDNRRYETNELIDLIKDLQGKK